MTSLNAESLRDIGHKVFGTREMTLNDAGAGYDVDEMVSAIKAVRRMMRSTLESLPESAFGKRAAVDGENEWSAGQVIQHVNNAQIMAEAQVRALLGMDATDDWQPIEMANVPTRAEAIDILEEMNNSFHTFIRDMPCDADIDKSAETERFGTLNTRGWLMLTALHESQHLGQLRSMDEQKRG